jgi:hypothetical protein
MVTWENYEEYMIMHADGELTASEEQALQAFISEHKELQSEMALYEQMRLAPEQAEVFDHKKQLLKTETATHVINLKQWRAYGAAAGILALICLGIIKWQLPQSTHPIAAQAPAAIPVTAERGMPAQPKEAIVLNNRPSIIHHSIKPGVKKGKNPVGTTAQKPVTATEGTIGKMAINTPKMLDNGITAPSASELQQIPVPMVAIPVTDAKQEKELSNRLATSQDNRAGIETLKNIITGGAQGIRQIRKDLKQTDISLSINGKELVVINF